MDDDKKFHILVEEICLYLNKFGFGEWKVDKKWDWYCNLVRDDGIEIGIRRNRQKLEISGNYTNDNYCMWDEVVKNKIGSAMTTRPATIANNIHRRLLDFVILKTIDFEKQDKENIKREAKQDTYCNVMVAVSNGERRTCNITDSTKYEVENKYKSTSHISWKANVRYDQDVDFRLIQNLTIEEACDVLVLLKELQDVRDAVKAERERYPATA